ncbi:unnamed protein product [Adineta steineri]|uniref:Uncharacterized protein n=1 Tax=Adineta steineri TaxID=433720 RepID=A0A813M6G6_9BILA|nr:unnamed protein product [Adineta steineri]CAF0723763.1 unnamed protein product [Adineta steineri]CAF3959709.1 unnamed protein product [Adineta steineri]CAF4127075.1 unnamed protein product [Adineta steineri]
MESRMPLIVRLLIVLVLYLLQGVVLGLLDVVSIYLASFGATWKQQGTLSFIMYPFSLKLLWAPLIDVYYIQRFGRHQTWLVPIQVLLGSILIVLSFFFESLLVRLRITELTVIFFFIVFLTATQDICVDGWGLTLFASSNVVWQAISQMIGQPLGGFIGSPIFLIFESANMTNKYIRQPLGIIDQPFGLFTLGQFVRFWGVVYLIAVCVISVLFRERQHASSDDHPKQTKVHLKLFETYMYILRLFKKKCFREVTFIIVASHIGFAASSSMTFLTLLR